MMNPQIRSHLLSYCDTEASGGKQRDDHTEDDEEHG